MSTQGTRTVPLLLAGLVLAASVVASVAFGVAWPGATAATVAAFAAGAAGVGLRARWGRFAAIAAFAVAAVAVAITVAVDALWWAIPTVAVAIAGGFVLRGLAKYLRPADALPAAVRSRLEHHVQFAGDSVAGLHVALRADGATFLVGYGRDGDERALAAFATAANAGRDILARQGLRQVTALCVVDGQKVRRQHGDVDVVSLDMVASMLDRVDAPAFDELVAVAEAAGVQLNRATARQVRSGRGQRTTKGTPNVVHQGRVTRRADT